MKKKMNWRLIKQYAMGLAGIWMFVTSASSIGRDFGYATGRHDQAVFTSMALDDAYGRSEATKIRNDINTEFDKYRNN